MRSGGSIRNYEPAAPAITPWAKHAQKQATPKQRALRVQRPDQQAGRQSVKKIETKVKVKASGVSTISKPAKPEIDIEQEEKAATNDAQRCQIAVKIALRTMRLSKDLATDDISSKVSDACRKLQGSLAGTSKDLDDLVAEVSNLLKRCVNTIYNISTPATQPSTPEIEKSCISFVFAGVRFAIRYLGTPPTPDAGPKIISRFQQRRETAQPIMNSSLDSALWILRTKLNSDFLQWDMLDSTLQDCSLLAERYFAIVDEVVVNPGAKDNKSDLPFVKISNIYWSYYLKLKQQSELLQDQNLLRCIRRSVDTLTTRPLLEKQAGFLAVKMEKLANNYQCLNKMHDARNFLRKSVELHVESGIMRNICTALRTKPVATVWEQEGEIGILGRTLGTLCKVDIKHTEDTTEPQAPFDDLSLDIEERAALLEWELSILCDAYSGSSSPEKYLPCIRALIKTLAEIYTEDDYPIRRLRVFLYRQNVLEHTSENMRCDDIFGTTLVEAMDQVDNLGKDKGLSRYLDGLQATVGISRALAMAPPDITRLKTALAAITTIFESCVSWDSFLDRIDSQKTLSQQLHSLTDFLDMQGLPELQVVTLSLMVKVHELRDRPDYSALVTEMSRLGLQFLRLGYSGKAGLFLGKAQNLIVSYSPGTQAKLQWHLAYAEYLIAIGSTVKGSECLNSAGLLANSDPDIHDEGNAAVAFKSRTTLTRIIADACYAHSLVAYEQGCLEEALSNAKRCVRLNYRAWATLEYVQSKRTKQSSVHSADKEVDTITDGMAALSTSTIVAHPVMSNDHRSLLGPSFWPLVSPLYRGLSHLSRLFSHHGLFQEAMYYAEQAQKVVEAVNAESLMADNYTIIGDYWTRGGRVEKGQEFLNKAEEIRKVLVQNVNSIAFRCAMGNLYRSCGDIDGEITAYEEAEKIMERLSTSNLTNGLQHLIVPQKLEEKMAKLNIKTGKPTRRPPLKELSNPSSGRRKPSTKPADGSSKATISTAGAECQPLLRLKGDIYRRKGLAFLMQKKCEQAASLLAAAENLPGDTQGIVQQRLAKAKWLLAEGLEKMAADPVFCVLPESTISFPSLSIAKPDPSLSLEKPNPKIAQNHRSSRTIVKMSHPKGTRVRSNSPKYSSFVDALSLASESLAEVRCIAAKSSSTTVVTILSSIQSNISMLLSAASPKNLKSFGHPHLAACWAESARMLPSGREKSIIQLEKAPKSREDLLKWPEELTSGSNQGQTGTNVEYSTFQKDYINILPPDWNVVSMSIAEDHNDLFISKYQADQTPFMLRLPLGRHSSRDADEEVFNFQQGQAELGDIIELSNLSTHGAKDVTRAGAKSEWWAEREALDARLKDLLTNIENIWLGGFKGILSQQKRHSDLLSRFQKSFNNILDKNLPSRQRSPGRSKAPKIGVDIRVLELFVGLGDPDNEAGDFDEPLTDLLYFIVDILQFHGEHNAYDEIDFDSIVVETQDALRCYHDAFRTVRNDGRVDDNNHTVLILDKSLQSFPWESLPCMEGLSVSRLPSFDSLRQRILAQQPSQKDDQPAGHHISKLDGAYVLNPAGDLKNTQSSFEEALKSFPTWDAVVQREPTEDEMRSALSKQLFLYFGHGSGAQFIRGRTIKKLESSAVTLLMGCSSGALTNAGEYEPYGTPMNYMHAGCPALVATLWDVTDKDIDRFSHAVFRRWGLFNEGVAADVLSKNARKGSKRHLCKASESYPTDGRPVSLVEAVSKSRDSCVLRYLNGAAPVVYGIPVYLS